MTLSLDSTISAYYGDVVENGNVDTDALKAFLEAYITVGEYNGIGGLAELLNHTAKDLDSRSVRQVTMMRMVRLPRPSLSVTRITGWRRLY